MLIDKVIQYISLSSPRKIILLSTLFVVVGSVPMVYMFSYLFGEPYSKFLLYISVLLPLILTPVTISLLIRLTTRLAHVKQYLEEEIQNNKEKDIILFEQARFVLIGEMMANISHQWKQPLNTINLALLNMKFSNLDIDSKNYDIIEDNVNYLASTIDDFISFFDKRTHSEMKSLDAIAREIHSIIDAHISNKKIELKIEIDESFSKIEVASSLSQVVLNLINNAKDALASAEVREINVRFIVKESGLQIACCDTGCGIEEKIQERIFAPYFTTKEKTQGTGIGLYMSKEIIHKFFDGKITFESKRGEGTCFHIMIPLSNKCEYIGDVDA